MNKNNMARVEGGVTRGRYIFERGWWHLTFLSLLGILNETCKDEIKSVKDLVSAATTSDSKSFKHLIHLNLGPLLYGIVFSLDFASHSCSVPLELSVWPCETSNLWWEGCPHLSLSYFCFLTHVRNKPLWHYQ